MTTSGIEPATIRLVAQYNIQVLLILQSDILSYIYVEHQLLLPYFRRSRIFAKDFGKIAKQQIS